MIVKVKQTAQGVAVVEKFRVRESSRAGKRVEVTFFLRSDGSVPVPLWMAGDNVYAVGRDSKEIRGIVNGHKPSLSLLENDGHLVKVVCDGGVNSVRRLNPIVVEGSSNVVVSEDDVTYDPFFSFLIPIVLNCDGDRYTFINNRCVEV